MIRRFLLLLSLISIGCTTTEKLEQHERDVRNWSSDNSASNSAWNGATGGGWGGGGTPLARPKSPGVFAVD